MDNVWKKVYSITSLRDEMYVCPRCEKSKHIGDGYFASRTHKCNSCGLELVYPDEFKGTVIDYGRKSGKEAYCR